MAATRAQETTTVEATDVAKAAIYTVDARLPAALELGYVTEL